MTLQASACKVKIGNVQDGIYRPLRSNTAAISDNELHRRMGQKRKNAYSEKNNYRNNEREGKQRTNHRGRS